MTENNKTTGIIGILVNEAGVLEDVLLNTVNGNNLASMRELLGVRTVDCVGLVKQIDCWVDDEALLISEPRPNIHLSVMVSLIGPTERVIFGSGLFLGTDGDGATISLTPAQALDIRLAHQLSVSILGENPYAPDEEGTR